MIDAETGTTFTRLTEGPRRNRHTAGGISPFSPDGTKIVYSSGSFDLDGTARIMLTGITGGAHWKIADNANYSTLAGASAKWSVDGNGIYYQGNDDREKFVWFSGSREIGPLIRHLSPDGCSGVWRESAEFKIGSGRDICLIDLETLETRVIIHIDDVIELCNPDVSSSSHPLQNPQFSPDGKKLIFSTIWGDLLCAVPRVCYCGKMGLVYLGKRGHCTWHPDSERVIGVRVGDDGIPGICEIRWDGTEDRWITRDRKVYGTPGSHPVYSPDGLMVASEGSATNAFAVFVFDVEGNGGKFVNCPDSVTQMNPVFSPDGTKILYVSDVDGAPQIHIAEVPK